MLRSPFLVNKLQCGHGYLKKWILVKNGALLTSVKEKDLVKNEIVELPLRWESS